MRSEFLRVAEDLIAREQRAMRPDELVELAKERGLFSDNIAGRTLHQTMKSKLSVHVRRAGDSSIFVRTQPGKFHLRRLVAPNLIYPAKPQHISEPHEDTLVFKSAVLGKLNRFQGIRHSWRPLHRAILKNGVCSYMDRLNAESDAEHKQVVTYIMLTRRRSVLAFKRGSFNRVADFLRGAHCIGFGGHVARTDADLFGVDDMGLKQSAVRELMEEVRLPERDRKRLLAGIGLRLVGVLNDDSSIVGQRHFAFLFQYEVGNDEVWNKPERGEKSITQLRWLGRRTGTVPIWDFEYWSQLCLREYFPWIAHAVPAYRIVRKGPLRSPHLLCVIGAVGSGKSEATHQLKKEFGYSEINTGKLLAELLQIPPLPTTPREEFQRRAWELIRQQDGPGRLAAAIWERAMEFDSGLVLVDGIRQAATLECLRQHAASSKIGVLYVHTLPDVAYKFYSQREQRGLTIFDFLTLRNAEVEQEVPSLIKQSDAVLYNWTGRKEYQQAVREMMRVVLSE